jgi:hypothetical protein
LFRHVSQLKGLENLTPLVAWLDALLKSWGQNPVCVSRVAPTSSVRVAMRDDMTELPIALCHLTFKRAISCMRKVIHIEQESFQKEGAQGTFPDLLAAAEDMSYLPWL